MVSRLAILALLLAAVEPSRAEVFKCVDGHGRTTYQQAPCAQGAKGSRVDITADNGVAADDPALVAKWTAAAKAGQILPGMPQRYVQAALGPPYETRAGLPGERAGEVWHYRGSGGLRSIGFVDRRLAWERTEDAPVAETPAGPGGATPGIPGDAANARQSIEPGQDCQAAVSAAGSPERSEAVLLPSTGPDGRITQSPGMRHVFASDGGRPPQSMAIVCQYGLVSEVQRPAR
ncbi:MAG: DUF4124 domain-containing protein [Burkholderiales bacterium]|jgi:hypothetical protein|nr:DUF4124 domain-containing protein [Burkholderiales bacterium]